MYLLRIKIMSKSNKQKIVISLYDDLHNPYYAGGGARVIHDIARRLVRTYDVLVLTGNYRGAQKSVVDGVTYKRIGPSFFGPKVSQLLFPLFLLMQAKKESYDVWIESFNPPFSSSFLPLMTKKPVIGFVQMLSSEDMQRKYKLPFHLVEKLGLKTYAHFIVFTKENKDKLQRINKHARYFLHPIGIETLPIIEDNKNEKHILYLGRIEFNQKGLDLLMEAYNAIAEESMLPLVIAGTGQKQDVTKLRLLIESYHLEEKVVLLGKVTGKQKDTLLKESALVVVPSRFDSYVLVALEAMAYGKPLVSFAIPGLSWVPSTCITKVRPFDTRKLGLAIKQILDDKRLKESMGTQGKLLAQNFLWDTLFPAYRQSIAAVLKQERN